MVNGRRGEGSNNLAKQKHPIPKLHAAGFPEHALSHSPTPPPTHALCMDQLQHHCPAFLPLPHCNPRLHLKPKYQEGEENGREGGTQLAPQGTACAS